MERETGTWTTLVTVMVRCGVSILRAASLPVLDPLVGIRSLLAMSFSVLSEYFWPARRESDHDGTFDILSFIVRNVPDLDPALPQS